MFDDATSAALVRLMAENAKIEVAALEILNEQTVRTEEGRSCRQSGPLQLSTRCPTSADSGRRCRSLTSSCRSRTAMIATM